MEKNAINSQMVELSFDEIEAVNGAGDPDTATTGEVLLAGAAIVGAGALIIAASPITGPAALVYGATSAVLGVTGAIVSLAED